MQGVRLQVRIAALLTEGAKTSAPPPPFFFSTFGPVDLCGVKQTGRRDGVGQRVYKGQF